MYSRCCTARIRNPVRQQFGFIANLLFVTLCLERSGCTGGLLLYSSSKHKKRRLGYHPPVQGGGQGGGISRDEITYSSSRAADFSKTTEYIVCASSHGCFFARGHAAV